MSGLIEKVMPYVLSVVLGAAAIGKLDELQLWILKAQLTVLQESKASNWGSPRFFPGHDFVRKK